MSLSMRGTSGQVKWGHQVAVQLGPWTMDGDRIEAVAHQVNSFWLARGQGKLKLSLTMGQKAWVWEQATVVDEGAPFVIQVTGSPEIRDVR